MVVVHELETLSAESCIHELSDDFKMIELRHDLKCNCFREAILLTRDGLSVTSLSGVDCHEPVLLNCFGNATSTWTLSFDGFDDLDVRSSSC